MKKSFFALLSLALGLSMLMIANTATTGAQDKFDLPEPYLNWEKSYLNEFPDLQKFLEIMITTTATQLQNPSEDILHNRVCSALAYEMSKERRPDRPTGFQTGDRDGDRTQENWIFPGLP